MAAWLTLAAIALAAVSGVPGLVLPRSSRAGERLAAMAIGLAGALALFAALSVLVSGDEATLSFAWSVPGGACEVRLDALSAVFLAPMGLVPALGAVYGLGYWSQREHRGDARKLRLFYGLMTAGMALVVVAANAILFLAGWEVMALGAFFLIATEDREPRVREAGFVYFVMTRLGTLVLYAMFATLLAATGGMTLFTRSPATLAMRPALANAVFLLALVGFGVKAGVVPLHVWLPPAHANAPSHVSAVMSGVLIKVGVYGLFRVTSLFGTPPLWWGTVVLGLGVVSGLVGVAFALGQHDLKRLLAYHSVENIGIILMGLGLALVGRATGRPVLVALGAAGALFHVWNHGLFKSLLFLSAGSVVHATGTREIDRLGGLAKRMPWTALAFAVGAVAICGLPPLNGFASELFVYLGLLHAVARPTGASWLYVALAAPALAMVGALAVACFVKAYGAVFLGNGRSDDAAKGHEAGATMLVPMAVLAGLCVVLGVAPGLVVPLLAHAENAWAPGLSATAPLASLVPTTSITIAAIALVILLLVATAAIVLRRRERARAATWACGYASAVPRAQYTASSFAQQLMTMLRWVVWPRTHRPEVRGLFPPPTEFHSEVPDVVLDTVAIPVAKRIAHAFGQRRVVQTGSVQAYLAYLLAAVVILLLLFHTGGVAP